MIAIIVDADSLKEARSVSVQCVATLGTTPTCAFDKLLEIGPVCEYSTLYVAK